MRAMSQTYLAPDEEPACQANGTAESAMEPVAAVAGHPTPTPEPDTIAETEQMDTEDQGGVQGSGSASDAEEGGRADDHMDQPLGKRVTNRKALLVVSQRAKSQPASAERSEDEDIDSSDDEEAVLERHVSPEQAAEDIAACRAMPEMVNIMEFLFLFRKQLKLQTVFTFDSLLDALVRSPGPGLLAQLHTELLKGVISGRGRPVDERTWAHCLVHRFKWMATQLKHVEEPLPFTAEKHMEAQNYAALPAKDRVLTLKALCDIRIEREDLRFLVEDTVVAAAGGGSRSKAAASSKAAAAAKPPLAPAGRSSRSSAPAAASSGPSGKRKAGEEEEEDLDPHRLRREPLGVDASGFIYHWLDWYEGHQEGGTDLGFILAREPTPTIPKGAPAASPARGGAKPKAKGKQQPYQRYQAPPQMVAGQWEVVASNMEELEAFGAKLQRSLRPADKKMADQINNVLITELKDRLDEQERWRKAKERTRKMLGLDAGLTLGRSVRQRKQVNYRDDEYDKVMSAALRAGGQADEPQGRRRARAEAPVTPFNDSGRRGRSRGSDTDLIALDMGGGSSRPSRARNAGVADANASPAPAAAMETEEGEDEQGEEEAEVQEQQEAKQEKQGADMDVEVALNGLQGGQQQQGMPAESGAMVVDEPGPQQAGRENGVTGAEGAREWQSQVPGAEESQLPGGDEGGGRQGVPQLPKAAGEADQGIEGGPTGKQREEREEQAAVLQQAAAGMEAPE